MSKFKVGDGVKIIGNSNAHCFKIGECVELYLRGEEACWRAKRSDGTPTSCNWVNARDIEIVSTDRHELHITSDGITTNAVYKLNGKVEKTAKAVCCPSDTYSFNTGAELAINRVLYGMDYNPKDLTPPPMTIVSKQEDKPKYKSGDKVKIVGNTACHCYKNGEIVTLVKKDVSAYSSREYWTTDKFMGSVYLADIEPYTEPEQPKEPIVLYCIKDYSREGRVTKGRMYTFENGGISNYDNGWKSCIEETFEDWKKYTFSIFGCLIKTEKRPALVGEYVLAIHSDYGKTMPANEVYLVTRINSATGGCGLKCPTREESLYFLLNEYLVLPDYIPKKVEPTYYSGKVVCVDKGWPDSSDATVGKVYNIINGEITWDSLGKDSTKIKSLEHLNTFPQKFIPYRGEQSC